MKRAAIELKKLAMLSHRWMGVTFCVLFAFWFVSGVVMMYSDYPRVGLQQRLERGQAIDPQLVRLTADEAYAILKRSRSPDEVQLTTFDGRPLYRFRTGQDRAFVYADNGQRQTTFPPDLTLRIASAWTGLSPSSAR